MVYNKLEYDRKYYLKNKEKILTRNRDWKSKNKKRINITIKQWRLKNPDKLKEQSRRYRFKNRELLKQKSKEWVKSHPNYYRKYNKLRNLKYHSVRLVYLRAYYLKNKDKFRKYNLERYYKNRVKICKRRNFLSSRLKKVVFLFYGGKCNYCGISDKDVLTIDHINDNGNKHRNDLNIHDSRRFYRWVIKNNFPKDLQVLCANCNLKKSIKARRKQSRLFLKERALIS